MTFDERANRARARLEGQLRFFRITTLVLLLFVIILGAVLVFRGGQKFARGIRIDGELVCLVRDQEAARRVHEALLEEGTGDLPGEAALKQEWEDEPWPVDSNRVLSVKQAIEALESRVTVLVEAYTIQVDEIETVYLPSEQFARDVLDDLKAQYLGDGQLVEPQTFLEDVRIAPVRAKAGEVLSEIGTAVEELQKTRTKAQTYTVKPDEWPEKIAAAHDMTIERFDELNPGIRGSVIHPGDEVTVAPAVSGITVKTVREVTRTEEIEPEVERIHSVELERGETEVVSEGVPGKKVIVEHHTYHNDRLVEKEVVSSQVVQQPSKKKVLVGTADSPAEGAPSEG